MLMKMAPDSGMNSDLEGRDSGKKSGLEGRDFSFVIRNQLSRLSRIQVDILFNMDC